MVQAVRRVAEGVTMDVLKRLVWVLDGKRDTGSSDIRDRVVYWYVDDLTIAEANARHGDNFWWSQLQRVHLMTKPAIDELRYEARQLVTATIDKDGAK